MIEYGDRSTLFKGIDNYDMNMYIVVMVDRDTKKVETMTCNVIARNHSEAEIKIRCYCDDMFHAWYDIVKVELIQPCNDSVII